MSDGSFIILHTLSSVLGLILVFVAQKSTGSNVHTSVHTAHQAGHVSSNLMGQHHQQEARVSSS